MSGRVLVGGGHRIDDETRTRRRFPAEREPAVRAAVDAWLSVHDVGAGDRAVCGGASGADIVFAEACLARDVPVDLLLARPPTEFVRSSVAPDGDGWVERFQALLVDRRVRVRVQADLLGPVPEGENRYARNNRWMLSHSLDLAPASSVHVLAVWDGDRAAGGPGGTADYVAVAHEAGLGVDTIDPA